MVSHLARGVTIHFFCPLSRYVPIPYNPFCLACAAADIYRMPKQRQYK